MSLVPKESQCHSPKADLMILALGLGLHFGLRKGAVGKGSSVNKNSAPQATPPQPSPPSNNSIDGPAVDSNFADPAYIRINDTFWAFATNKFVKGPSMGQVNIQVAKSADFESWELLDGQDALPTVGAWSAGFQVWAPDVVRLDDGTFMLYYSAISNADTSKHCIGYATATNVTGPYTPSDTALVCPLDQGGAIDPEGYKDADGTRYLIYKVDGNSLNRPDTALHSTPILLQQVAADGVTLIGEPTQLLDRTDADGPLVEAPAMARYTSNDTSKPPVYVLFYSSNVFTTPAYDVSYATSSSVKGPFARSNAPLLKTGDAAGKLVGPGGLDCGIDSTQVVFHSLKFPSSPDGEPVTRTMWTGDLDIWGDGTSPPG